MKKLISLIMTATLAVSMAVPVMANSISFSDISANHWAYNSIMNMVNKGVIAGTTTPVNGVGTFAPNDSMTRAQFITVVTRYVYPNELASQPKAEPWYMSNYYVAVDMGLINEYEFNSSADVMNKPMTRQEMAMVLVRAMDALGEDTSNKVPESRIPDYNKVGGHYKDYVRVAYKEGLIAGVDTVGTFNPGGTLTRAQAATVLNRLIDASTRTPASDVAPVAPEKEEIGVTGTSWYEGASHSSAPKAGDTVIKADGTKVVLKYGIGGVLGAGQGIDAWTGYKTAGQIAPNYYNGTQKGPDMTTLEKCEITGECHTSLEWEYIKMETNPTGEWVGDYEGEIANTWWQWDAQAKIWFWIGA